MKTSHSNQRNHGLTLMETVVVAFVLAIVVAVLLPALAPPRRKARINCTNNLKQVGLAFRIWAGDNNDKYPMAVSVTNGGAMEAVQGGAPVVVFQVMSNELSTPKVLFCPEEEDRQYATNFGPSLSANNVSYFVNPDIKDEHSPSFMSGDDNLETNGLALRSGISEVSSNSPLAWTARRHKFSGNIGMADGSVQGMNNSALTNWLHSTNFTTMHLAIP
jgi:prepilin-type processing-associated H-X9-DG protein